MGKVWCCCRGAFEILLVEWCLNSVEVLLVVKSEGLLIGLGWLYCILVAIGLHSLFETIIKLIASFSRQSWIETTLAEGIVTKSMRYPLLWFTHFRSLASGTINVLYLTHLAVSCELSLDLSQDHPPSLMVNTRFTCCTHLHWA